MTPQNIFAVYKRASLVYGISLICGSRWASEIHDGQSGYEACDRYPADRVSTLSCGRIQGVQHSNVSPSAGRMTHSRALVALSVRQPGMHRGCFAWIRVLAGLVMSSN